MLNRYLIAFIKILGPYIRSFKWVLLLGTIGITWSKIAAAKISVHQVHSSAHLSEILPTNYKIIHWGSESIFLKARVQGKFRYFKLIDTRPPDLNYSLLEQSVPLQIEKYINRPIEGMMAADRGSQSNPYVHLPDTVWIYSDSINTFKDKKKSNGREFSYNCVLEFSQENFMDSDLASYLHDKVRTNKSINEKLREVIKFANSTIAQAANLITSLEHNRRVLYIDFKLENMVVNKEGIIKLIDPDSLIPDPNSNSVAFPKNDPAYDLPAIKNDIDLVMRMQWSERLIQGANTFTSKDNYYRIGASTLKLIMLAVNSILMDNNSKWTMLLGKKLSSQQQKKLIEISEGIDVFLKKKNFFDREEYHFELEETMDIIRTNFSEMVLPSTNIQDFIQLENLLKQLATSLSIDRVTRSSLQLKSLNAGQYCSDLF